ncbi:MAG: hypothetical protein KDD89_02280 [Anaerolineales bacterium]|nr:hypothetical protein [Anaerolineales bacterium]
MSKRSSWVAPVIIVLILIGSGVATVMAPQIMQTVNNTTSQLTPGGEGGATAPVASEPEKVLIDIPGMFYTVGTDMMNLIAPLGELNGTEVSSAQALVVVTSVVVFLVVATAVPIGLIVILGDRSTNRMKEDDGYQEAMRNIENEQKTFVKERLETQPPNEKPIGVMPRWSVLSTTLVLVALSYFGGVVFGSAVGGDPVTWGQIFALIGLIVCLLTVRPQRVLRVDDSMNARPPWSSLWVMFSGALVVGLGLGAMYAVITGSNPFEFLSWEWFQTNVLSLLA